MKKKIIFGLLVLGVISFSKAMVNEEALLVESGASSSSGAFCPGTGGECFELNIAWGLIHLNVSKG